MKTKSKVTNPATTPTGTAGNPPTATPTPTGTTSTRADVATVMSDRKGRRAAVARAMPASVTTQPVRIRLVRPSRPTPCSVRRPPAGAVFASGSCQERTAGHQQDVNGPVRGGAGAYERTDERSPPS